MLPPPDFHYQQKKIPRNNFSERAIIEQPETIEDTEVIPDVEILEVIPLGTALPETPSESDVPEISYKRAITSYFWVGEKANAENGFIANSQSAWDVNWLEHYGGVDDPNIRCGFLPCGFLPKENPFYFALPYSDLDGEGNRKSSALNIPWAEEVEEGVSLLKNRWIEVIYGKNTCFAQWEDIGPFATDDFEYVFGNNTTPKNTFGLKAGLDVSPAARDCLGLHGNGETRWRFVPEDEVPAGPWKAIVTRNVLESL